MSAIEIIVIICCVLVVVGVIIKSVVDKKHGVNSCGECSSCPYSSSCGKKRSKKKK